MPTDTFDALLANLLPGIRDLRTLSTLDRLTSECEFRVGVAAPLVALITTLAWRSSLLWLFGMLLVLALARSGVKRRVEAGDLLADVVRLGRIDVPVPSEFQLTAPVPVQDGDREPAIEAVASTA